MKQKHGNHANVWNKEYKTGGHLKLSTQPGEDFLKGLRFIERQEGKANLNPTGTALDLGCGNGRHLIHLAQAYGMRGTGYDISPEAIKQAREASQELPLSYETRSIAGHFDEIKDGSVAIALDLMVSHFLKADERKELLGEIVRVLKPGGWLLFKSFLADEDLHTKRLLKEHPAGEAGAYIHPEFGVYEYVWTEEGLRNWFSEAFETRKIEKSHRHLDRAGRANKRRTITAYFEKQ